MIVPAYNEESRLPTMLKETIDILENRTIKDLGYKYEIIIVDDGSKDKTTKIALEYTKDISAEKCRVLTLGNFLVLNISN